MNLLPPHFPASKQASSQIIQHSKFHQEKQGVYTAQRSRRLTDAAPDGSSGGFARTAFSHKNVSMIRNFGVESGFSLARGLPAGSRRRGKSA
jgi:hypothetical protein